MGRVVSHVTDRPDLFFEVFFQEASVTLDQHWHETQAAVTPI